MGKRLSKIYTRTGDKGTTGLGDGSRIDKSHPRMELIGTVDEVNCWIGLLAAREELDPGIREILLTLQHRLFDLGGELAMPGHQLLTEKTTEYLERRLDDLNADLPPLEEFVLPGGNLAAASCHYARTVCRRAERRLMHLSQVEPEQVGRQALKFLNRLSDLLFVMARTLARRDGQSEVYWRRETEPGAPS